MSTHTLDGYDVLVGDAVHDSAFGSGKVTHLGDGGSITVGFGDGRSAGYVAGRTRRFTIRTLYWQNPVIATPPKDDRRWMMVRTMAASAAEAARTLGVDNVSDV